MLSLMHSQFWDGGEGGGGDPPAAPATTQFSGWQIVAMTACTLLLLLRV